MARGTLYELETNPENLFSKSESEFYDYAGHQFEYISQEEPEGAARTLIGRMQEEGAETGTERIPASDIPGYGSDEGTVEVPWFEVTPEVRKNYFLLQFRKMKKLAENMTLSDFVDGIHVFDLREAAEEHYGDAVTMQDNGFASFDAFMRNAEGRYYVGNVFFMG